MSHRTHPALAVASLFLLFCLAIRPANAQPYDPLRTTNAPVETLDFTVRDEARQRDIPVRVYLPPAPRAASPLILFSHGLGGSRENNP